MRPLQQKRHFCDMTACLIVILPRQTNLCWMTPIQKGRPTMTGSSLFVNVAHSGADWYIVGMWFCKIHSWTEGQDNVAPVMFHKQPLSFCLLIRPEGVQKIMMTLSAMEISWSFQPAVTTYCPNSLLTKSYHLCFSWSKFATNMVWHFVGCESNHNWLICRVS